MFISFIRTIFIYLLIMAAVRLMGKRQISQLQTTELVATLLISDLAVIPMQDSGQPLTSGLIPIFVLVSIEIIISVVMIKNSKIRKLICGKPMIIIKDGKLLQSEMKELRLSIEDIFEELRKCSVFSLKEIKYGIIETNGTLSIMKNEEFENVKVQDLELNIPKQNLDFVVISDGDLCYSSLKLCDKDKYWIEEIITKEQIELDEIFIMTANCAGEYSIVKKEI